MPGYRSRDQVWIWLSMDHPTFLWGENKPNIFNWTMSYRRDSTIKMPFSTMREMTDEEKRKIQTFFYELQKHGLETEILGKCGLGKICTEFKNDNLNYICLQDQLGRYKFYIAFENRFCRDYITEKFWLSLSRNQVPIVAWKFNATGIVPPGSCINIFDFHSVRSAAEYILSRRFKIGGDLCNLCKMCKELHTKRPAQVYTDIEGWLRQDTCEKTRLVTLIFTILNRICFYLGLG
ncbi:hypothetical protein ACJMK2_000574 [Sinanodonta woodiana]|uniref:Fucosyltransferase n=1 Tax=Sinanodonta woodiana TaxID=1069815 RepID=A0ABD3XPN6_SINWO